MLYGVGISHLKKLPPESSDGFKDCRTGAGSEFEIVTPATSGLDSNSRLDNSKSRSGVVSVMHPDHCFHA